MPEQALLAKLGPDLRVVVWAGQGPLTPRTAHFDTFDYLLDGLPLRQTREQSGLSELTFVHTLFGKNTWVFYFDVADVKWEALAARFAIIPADAREKLLVVNTAIVPDALVKKLDTFFGFVEHA